MRPIVTVVARSVACVSVSVCVGYRVEQCKNGRTDRDAVWGRKADSHGPKEPCIRWNRGGHMNESIRRRRGLLPNYSDTC